MNKIDTTSYNKIESLSLHVEFNSKLDLKTTQKILRGVEEFMNGCAAATTAATNSKIEIERIEIDGVRSGSFTLFNILTIFNESKELFDSSISFNWRELFILASLIISHYGLKHLELKSINKTKLAVASIKAEKELKIKALETAERLSPNDPKMQEIARDLVKYCFNENSQLQLSKSLISIDNIGKASNDLAKSITWIAREEGEETLQRYDVLNEDEIKIFQFDNAENETVDLEDCDITKILRTQLDIRVINKDSRVISAIKCKYLKRVTENKEFYSKKKNLIITNDKDRDWIKNNNNKLIMADINVYYEPESNYKKIRCFELVKLYKRNTAKSIRPKKKAKGGNTKQGQLQL